MPIDENAVQSDRLLLHLFFFLLSGCISVVILRDLYNILVDLLVQKIILLRFLGQCEENRRYFNAKPDSAHRENFY